jgi:hypothetical protein
MILRMVDESSTIRMFAIFSPPVPHGPCYHFGFQYRDNLLP